MEKRNFLRKYNHRKLEWLHDALFFIIAIIFVFIIFKFVIGFSYISGESMEPNLHNGEAVIYLRTVRNYQNNDVVSIWVPSGHYYVKRIIARGGDVVDIRDGVVYVNDVQIDDAYGVGATLKEDGPVIYPYKVREGNYFVLGDNREASMDSRGFGEVNKKQVRGRIVLRIGRWYVKGVD